MGEKLYLAVRQPEDDKKIIVAAWGWYPVWENWTWPGREAIRTGFTPGAVQVKAEADGLGSALASFAVAPVEA